MPVVGKLERQARVISGFYNNDVGGEVRSKQQAQCLDYIRSLWLAARDAELGELLVGTQHNQVGTEDHASLLLLVVIDLHSCVVRNTEGNDSGLVASGARFMAPTAIGSAVIIRK